MLGRRSPQGELFRPDHTLREHVGEGTFYGLLCWEGGRWFRDEDFEGLYREDFGRPSVPPSQLCVALLLQAHDGVSDEEAIQRSAYDLRWKVALGLELEEKLCAKSTLQLFRAKLVLHERYAQLFEKSVAACREAGLMRRAKLTVAIDTTPVLGRGAVKDTFNLVSGAIVRLVEEACRLKEWERDVVVAEQGLGRHFAASFKGAVDLDWSDAEARRALVGQLVGDARVALRLGREALRGFAKEAPRAQRLREARDLLVDLLAQDIEEAPEDGGGPRVRRGTAPDRIVSTTDPEMRHGHKSRATGFEGYKATVVAETEAGVILSTGVRPANVHDREGAKERIEEAGQRAGAAIACVLSDTAYGDTETRTKVESLGAEVVTKVPPGTRRGMFGLDDFKIDARRGVARCPAAKRSRRRDRIEGKDPGWRYVFSRRDCGPCRLRTQCTKSVCAARVVQVTQKTRQLQVLRHRQRTKRFRQRYRERVVVEHRIARLVQLGLRQARYLGQAKVSFQASLLATVANLSLVAAILAPSRLPSLLLQPLEHIARLLDPGGSGMPRVLRRVLGRTAAVETQLTFSEMAPSRPDL
jgi:hypothetical protein